MSRDEFREDASHARQPPRERSDEVFRDLVETHTDLICRFLPDGTLLYANEAYRRFFGIAREEAEGFNFATLIPEEDREAALAHFRTFTPEAPTHTQEHQVIGKQGRTHWFQWRNTAVFDENGKVAEFVGVGREITDRKRNEAALKENELRNRLIVEAANVAVWDWDLETDVTEWNETLTELFGYPAGRVENSKQWWLDYIHPEHYRRVAESIQKHLSSGGDTWREEYRFRHADGRWMDVIDWGLAVRDESGKATRMVGAMMDITDRKQADGVDARVGPAASRPRKNCGRTRPPSKPSWPSRPVVSVRCGIASSNG